MKSVSLIVLLTFVSFTSFGQGSFNKHYSLIKDSVMDQYEDFVSYYQVGIVSNKKGEVFIPKTYGNIVVENEYLICKIIDTSTFKNSYDIYTWSKKEIKPYKLNISSYADFPLEIYHSGNKGPLKIEYCHDSTYYTLKTKNGTGLYFIDLFEYSYKYSEIFEPIYEFVAPIGDYNDKVAAIKDGNITVKQLIDGELPFTSYPFSGKESIYFDKRFDYDYGNSTIYVDGTIYPSETDSITGNVYYNAIEKSSKNPRINFYGTNGIEILNDSLIYLQSVAIEQDFLVYDENGQEIFDYESNYYLPGEFNSGVYNLNQQKWIVDRNKSFAMKTYLGYLEESAHYSIKEKNHNYTYSFKSNNGDYQFENISYDELMKLQKVNQFITPVYKVDSTTPFMDVHKVWSNGACHFYTTEYGNFNDILPNHKEYEGANLPFIHEVSLEYTIEDETIRIFSEDYDVSYPLSGDIILFEASTNDNEYMNKLFLRSNNQLFDISNLAYDNIKEIEIVSIDSLLSLKHNVILKSQGDSVLIFTNYDSETFNDDFNEYGELTNGLENTTTAYSGIYNYKNKTWIVEPQYKLVLPIEDNYILWSPQKLDVNYNDEDYSFDIEILEKESFKIVNKVGQTIETTDSIMKLPNKYLRQLDPFQLANFKLNSIEEMQIRYGLVSYIEDSELGSDGVFYGKTKNGKWGCYQSYTSKEIIPALYDSINQIGWSNPFTIVWNNGKAGAYKGLFDTPELSVKCIYDNAKIDSENSIYYLAVEKNGKWAYVDWFTGEELTEFIYDSFDELPSSIEYKSVYYK